MEEFEYEYKKVADIKEGDTKINIIGVVKYFRSPRVTSINQYNLLCTVIDPSVEDNIEKGIRCILFAFEKINLPQVENIGDIIRLHRVNVKSFNGRLQVQQTKATSWVVYPTEHFDSTKYKSSHKNPSIKVRDRKNVEELYHWMLKIEDRIKERTKNTENTSLCDIKLETYFNCICQVVGIYYFQEESNHCLLKVTDGTKINFNSLRQTGSIEGKQKVGLLDLSKEFIYDISLFDDHVDDVKDIKEKDYVKIVNVHAKSVTDELAIKAKKTLNLEEDKRLEGWVELVVHTGKHHGRCVQKLDPDHETVEPIKKRLLLVSEQVKNTLSTKISAGKMSKLTSTRFPARPYTTIDNFVSEAQNGPTKGKLKVKVLKLHPATMIKEFIYTKCCVCKYLVKYSQSNGNEFNFNKRGGKVWEIKCCSCHNGYYRLIYIFQMIIEDETGIMDVLVAENDALTFFNGVSPGHVLTDGVAARNLQTKLDNLIGGREEGNIKKDDVEKLIEIDLCAYSFLSQGERCCRLFGTTLV